MRTIEKMKSEELEKLITDIAKFISSKTESHKDIGALVLVTLEEDGDRVRGAVTSTRCVLCMTQILIGTVLQNEIGHDGHEENKEVNPLLKHILN